MTESGNATTISPRTLAWLAAAVVAMFCLLYLLPLEHRPLFIPDESRYAEIPRGMVVDGDWVRLRHAGIPYYEKPPLGYWLTAASLWLFGLHPFAVRLPSALAAGLAALAVYLMMRRAGRARPVSLAAAMIFLSCLGVFGVGTYAVLDSMFALFTTLSMAAFFTADTYSGRRRLLWLILSGAACAAAFLTKGFTAVVIPALTLAVWLPWERRPRDLLTVWIVPMLAAAAVSLPFALVIHEGNPDFWRYFVWVEHVQRFLAPGDGQHGEPVWFYLPVLFAAVLPWLFLLPAAAPEARRLAASDSFARYCLCWFAMPILFFSACSGKLPTYILPCLPPFAMLLADALMATPRAAQLRGGALAGAGLLVAGFVGFGAWLLSGGDPELSEAVFADSGWMGLVAALLLAIALLAVAAGLFGGGGSRLTALAVVALAFCGIFWASIYCLPKESEDRKSPSRLLEAVVPLTPPGALLVSDAQTLSSVSWHYGREDAVVAGGTGEFHYGLDRPEAKGRLLPIWDAATLVPETLAAGRPVSVVLRETTFEMFAYFLKIEPARVERRSVFVWALYLPPAP